MSNRIPADKITWHKANEDQLAAYYEALVVRLTAVAVSFDAILCHMFVALVVVIIFQSLNTQRESLMLA